MLCLSSLQLLCTHLHHTAYPASSQAIVLDALTNRADAKIVSSNSMGQPGRAESVTYVVTVNVQADCIDYNGTYRWNSLT